MIIWLECNILHVSGELKSQLSDRIEHAVDLFDILERRGFLDSNNLLYLQSLLFHAHRHDLFERVAKFASQTLQNAVYFQKPPDEPGMISLTHSFLSRNNPGPATRFMQSFSLKAPLTTRPQRPFI